MEARFEKIQDEGFFGTNEVWVDKETGVLFSLMPRASRWLTSGIRNNRSGGAASGAAPPLCM